MKFFIPPTYLRQLTRIPRRRGSVSAGADQARAEVGSVNCMPPD
jgi:hypothetical protein